MVLASSTVIVPSLPTFSIASAMISPMPESQLAETVATCLISSEFLIFLEIEASSLVIVSQAASMPRLTKIGFAPAETLLRPSV